MDNDAKNAKLAHVSVQDFMEAKKQGIENAHETLAYFEKRDSELAPLPLVLETSHLMLHILMACPSIKQVYEVMQLFLQDLDFEGIIDLYKEEKAKDKPEAESYGNSVTRH